MHENLDRFNRMDFPHEVSITEQLFILNEITWWCNRNSKMLNRLQLKHLFVSILLVSQLLVNLIKLDS